MTGVQPCLIPTAKTDRRRAGSLGDPLPDAYLEFVAARSRPNTVLATRFDVKVFFTVIGGARVRAADVVGRHPLAPRPGRQAPRETLRATTHAPGQAGHSLPQRARPRRPPPAPAPRERVETRTANAPVAEEHFTVAEKIDALHARPAQLPEDPSPNLARLNREHHHVLGNGYCTRPNVMGCQ